MDLPDAECRALIFGIHLDKRELDASKFDLDTLATEAKGFSGSEIEQAVVAGLYSAHARGQKLDQTLLLDEIAETRPLSVVMSEKIEALRAWAADRTVPAN